MRQSELCTFTAIDGTPVFYRHWPASGATDRAVILLHRGHEHSGRLQHVVDELDLPEHAMFAWDARGHGLSPGRRGYAPSVGTLIKDLDTFVRHITATHETPMANVSVVAQSVASVVAAAWAHDYAPKIRSMVLAAPAFEIKLYVPFARRALTLLHKLIGDFTVQSYVQASYLTHDPERIAAFQSDRLITRSISAKILLEMYQTAERIVADAQAIQVPTQVLVSGADFVVHKKPQIEFFHRLGSSIKEIHELNGFYHDTLGEKERHLAIGKARVFILKSFATAPSLLDADKTGATRKEFDRLSRPLPRWSPRAIAFRVIKAGMKAGTRVSPGIRIGQQTGFDSGSTLDYVYRNRASGRTPLGQGIDRLYLNSIGWRGIRIRKQNVEHLLTRSIADLRTAGRPVNIVDIAAGHGRYILDAIGPDAAPADASLLRDYDAANVRAGNTLIAARGMSRSARFEQGNAFDPTSLAAISPRATIGVVSGLYELFPDNAEPRESLAGLSRAIEPDGYLIYTGQPWHPQMEMIARTLSSHRDGKPWIMRRRTQAELDQLVEAAGFRKIDQLTGRRLWESSPHR